MPTISIRKNDEVQVISGKDKGKRGRVVNVLPKEQRVMVEGVARATKHTRTRGRRSRGGSQLQQGGLVQQEQFIDLSNVMVVCKHCGKPTRVGHRVDEDTGTKVRICRKCEGEL
jgi:large subunit ribosomal protein L24